MGKPGISVVRVFGVGGGNNVPGGDGRLGGPWSDEERHWPLPEFPCPRLLRDQLSRDGVGEGMKAMKRSGAIGLPNR